MAKTILVVGGGGREHALCWKLAQSPEISQIYCAPGNAGTAETEKTKNIAIAVNDFQSLLDFAQKEAVDFVVIGPDNPLADGIVDMFQVAGIAVFGPTQKAAQLESSKVFSKQFMLANQLPTAKFEVFSNPTEALAFCRENAWARIIKVDGLALGKGVYVCDTLGECEDALTEIFEAKRFGTAGTTVVIEERLYGPEISLMVLCDGQTMKPLASSQDYKRRFENNMGPNTGGMGVYSPVPQYETLEAKIKTDILEPLECALQAAEFVYQGLLYIGLLIHNNQPYILEFNARFGDPETQCVLPRLENDLYPLFSACVSGTLSDHELSWTPNASVCVVLCGQHYPESGSKGESISLPTAFPKDVLLFHAGTCRDAGGRLLTQGGRVLNLVALGETHEKAREIAYYSLQSISFPGMAYRKDIAQDVSLCLSK